MKFFIFHGTYGNPDGNWFPWLKKEIEKKGHEAVVPKFPTPIGQTLESWLKVINQYESKIGEDTILIGHSSGAVFILDYLEKIDKEIKAAILVAGWHQPLKNKLSGLNKSFDDKKFNWEKIAENCGHFFVIGSDNDEYVPIETTRQLAVLLDAELHIIDNGGHLNSKAGFEEFPQLLQLIDKIAKQ